MPEQPEKKKHRNRIYSIPTLGDGGPLNCFSRGDFLSGKSPTRYGSDQQADIFTTDERASDSDNPTPDLWPKLWPQAGRILNVPKVVILSDFIAWPEFWENCVFDFPHDVTGLLFTLNIMGNYYYLDQWNVGSSWRNNDPPSVDTAEYRYSQIVAQVQNPYFRQHQSLWTAFRKAKKILESDPKDPIYVILPNWIPKNDYEIPTNNKWTAWKNDDVYWPGNGQAQTDVIHGHSACDIFLEGTNRGRVHPDPSAPGWRSDALNAPTVPTLLSGTPYFGTDVLHLWIGHWCTATAGGGPLSSYETYPLSPGAIQIGPVIQGTYLGSPIPGFDGRRNAWRDAGFDYGYMGGVDGILSYYNGAIANSANEYKTNFWKYRNFATRYFAWTDPWAFGWNADQIKEDQKWCAAGHFYDGFTFQEFAQSIAGEDSYAVDYAAETNGVRFANVVIRSPDSPSIRDAVKIFFPPLRMRVEKYYSDSVVGIDAGTATFLQKMIEQQGLADYNVRYKGKDASIFTVDGIVEYVRSYFNDPDREI